MCSNEEKRREEKRTEVIYEGATESSHTLITHIHPVKSHVF